MDVIKRVIDYYSLTFVYWMEKRELIGFISIRFYLLGTKIVFMVAECVQPSIEPGRRMYKYENNLLIA